MDNPLLGASAAFATAVLWTLSAIAWTASGRQVGSLAVSFIRLLLACVPLALYSLIAKGQFFPWDTPPDVWWYLGLSGLAGFFVADVCYFKSLVLIGPRLCVLLQSFAPPLTAILSWLTIQEKLTPTQWLGMLVTVGGIGWVVLERPDGTSPRLPARALRYGILLALIGSLGQAVGLVLSKRGLSGPDYDPFDATFVRIVGAMLGYLPLLTLLGRWNAVGRACRQLRPMIIISLGTLVGPFLGVVTSLIAVRHTATGVVATIIATMPVMVLPISVFVYKESITLRTIGGIVLSVIGVAMVSLTWSDLAGLFGW